MLAAVFLMAFSVAGRADTKISSRVTGPPPTQGAVILTPSDGQHFNYTPIQITGTCPDGTYVKIVRNNTFGGSTFCQPSNSFSLQIDLTPGSNQISAQDYDLADQPGPATASVTVTYDMPIPLVSVPPTINPSPTPPSSRNSALPGANNILTTSPLIITSDTSILKGLTPNVAATWQVTVRGGQAPYALRWSWGDGLTNLYSLSNGGIFKASHTYKKSGNYTITINASDAAGNLAFLQLGAQVNGPVAPTGPTIRSDGSLLIAWPLWLLAALMIASFWMGDKYKQAHSRTERQLQPGIY